MTRNREMGAAMPSTDGRAAVAVALRLALARPRVEDWAADWSLVYDAASREMLAGLAWARSGAYIRRNAPPDVSAAWRRAALAAEMRGQHQLQVLRGVTRALDECGVQNVVLKGLPLAERLYGEPFVRPSADVDLYVPAHQRGRAAAMVRALGWTRVDGEPPWHEAWTKHDGDRVCHLEFHSSLVSDHLAHLPVDAPATATVLVNGAPVRAHAGPFLAPYLAVHLATHQLPPLLWVVDFATLWHSLSVDEQRRAEHVAADARVDRYLAWACTRAALAERAASGDREALGRLGVGRAGRKDGHSIWRHLALAASPADACRVAAAFVAPRRLRGDIAALASYTLARLRTRLGSLASASRAYGAPAPTVEPSSEPPPASAPRPLRVERGELVSLVHDVVRSGGALRIRAPGGSMLPTIPRGALVRVGPVPPGGLAKGDIVLALTRDGEPVLHRAVAAEGDLVITRGDAALHDDPAIPLSRVIGVATHVTDESGERRLGPRPARSIAVSALKLRRRLARVVRRAR